MTISAQAVKELRERTGAGMMDCRKALEAAGCEVEKAIEWLRTQGIAKATKRAGRAASEGLVSSYVHLGGKLGVIVEVNCETDFVARTDDFQTLAHELAMQVAASSPLAVSREDLPADLVERERAIYREQVQQSGKPEKIWERIVEGKLEKFYQDSCLMEQASIREPSRAVGDMVKEVAGKLGENVVVRRFARFQIGEA
ncbi:translation elongation factor Ts [Candidatus Fermentibacteria bacterium]|nr:translation elongation factor Ts [Candidatus Fermentibacteria bacterium]